VGAWLREGSLEIERMPQEATAAVLGVTRQAMSLWARRDCPRNSDGTYDLGAVVRWRVAELEEREQRARRVAGQGRVRRDQAQAELAELQLAERKGEMLPRTALIAGWVARYRTMQSMLLGLVRRLGQYGLDREQAGRIEDDLRSILEQLGRGPVLLPIPPEVAKFLRPPKRAGQAGRRAAEAADGEGG